MFRRILPQRLRHIRGFFVTRGGVLPAEDSKLAVNEAGHCSAIPLLVLAVLAAVPVAAQDESVRPMAGETELFADAYQLIEEFAAREMEYFGTPGMALALTSRNRLLRIGTFGFADIKGRKPVTAETLFPIASISKSFTAIALLQMRDEGLLDVHRPVFGYLPWFGVRAEYETITAHHLLTHSSGLPRNQRGDIPSSLYQVVAALNERQLVFSPGSTSSYSNIGFQVLGHLLEDLTGEDYGRAVRRRILEPLGMTASEPVLTHDTRRRLATGYLPYYDDRPPHRSHGLEEAPWFPWFEYGAGDGSVAATAGDLAVYLQMLLNHGSGPKGRILSEESFELLVQRTVKAHDNEFSGYGIGIRDMNGRMIVWHAGGAVGYASMLMGDLTTGVGVIVLINGPGNPGRVADFALHALHAAHHDKEMPVLPELPSRTRVLNAASFVGVYTSSNDENLEVVAEGESLWLVHEGERIPLEPRGPDTFSVLHPDFSLFLLRFGREQKSGDVIEATHGSRWYPHSRYSGPRTFEHPAHWETFVGHYRSYKPEMSNFRILLRKGGLWLVHAGGGEQELVEVGEEVPGLFQIAGELSAERLQFFDVIGGRALRAEFQGTPYYRFFTP